MSGTDELKLATLAAQVALTNELIEELVTKRNKYLNDYEEFKKGISYEE